MMLLLLFVLILPGAGWGGASPASTQMGIVLQPVANLYSGPSEDTDVVSQAIYGSRVVVVEDKQEWTKVSTPDDYSGWMRATALKRVAEGDHLYASSGRVAQVEQMFAHLYREPDVTKHQPLITVPFETRLEVIAEPEKQTRWLQVKLPDDRTAWLQRGDVTLDVHTVKVAQMIQLAKHFLGLPYTWGGTSSYGYDCSGFMQMLYRRHGVILPRDAGPQAHWTGLKPVSRRKLRAGDLLYFGRSEEKITHTGMYIGRGRFIHATTHDHPVIQISRLKETYWTKLLVAERRLKGGQ